MATSIETARQTDTILRAIRSLQSSNNVVLGDQISKPVVDALSVLQASITASFAALNNNLIRMVNRRLPAVPVTPAATPARNARAVPGTSQPVGPAGFLDAHILTALLDIRRILEGGIDKNAGLRQKEEAKEAPKPSGLPMFGGRNIGDWAETFGGFGSALLLGYALFSLKWKQLTGQMSEWLDTWFRIVQSFTPTVLAITNVVRGIASLIGVGLNGVFGIIKGLSATTAKVLGFFGGAFKGVAAALDGVFGISKLLALPLKFLSKVLWPIQLILSAFDFAAGGLDAYNKTIAAGGSQHQAILAGVIGGVGKVIDGIFSGMGTILKWVWDGVMSPFEGVKKQVEDFTGKIWSMSMGAIAGGMKFIVNSLWLPDEVKSWFNSSIEDFLGVGKASTVPTKPEAKPMRAKTPTATAATNVSTLVAKQQAVTKRPVGSSAVVVAPSSQVNNVQTTIAPQIRRSVPPSPVDPQAARMLTY